MTGLLVYVFFDTRAKELITPNGFVAAAFLEGIPRRAIVPSFFDMQQFGVGAMHSPYLDKAVVGYCGYRQLTMVRSRRRVA